MVSIVELFEQTYGSKMNQQRLESNVFLLWSPPILKQWSQLA